MEIIITPVNKNFMATVFFNDKKYTAIRIVNGVNGIIIGYPESTLSTDDRKNISRQILKQFKEVKMEKEITVNLKLSKYDLEILVCLLENAIDLESSPKILEQLKEV